MKKPKQKLHSIRLQSGNFFDFLDPWHSVFTVDDIAHNISKEARFNGANDGHKIYSVAQHAVNASYIVEEGFEFEALHHDDTEAFYKDLTTWLKQLVPAYRVLEGQGAEAIADFLKLPRGFDHFPAVKMADLQMLKMEKAALFSKSYGIDGFHHITGIETIGLEKRVDLKPWSVKKSYDRYLRRHEELMRDRI